MKLFTLIFKISIIIKHLNRCYISTIHLYVFIKSPNIVLKFNFFNDFSNDKMLQKV